jgi:SAM-dependent methyltransferase
MTTPTVAEFLLRSYPRPLRDLGEVVSAEFAGIYSPSYDAEALSRHVHEQFRAGAGDWAARYGDTSYFRWLLGTAFDRIRPGLAAAELTVLDVGSGSGNTLFPLLELCPRARVVASDLSPEMLLLIRRGIAGTALERRCALLQLNAEEIDFAPGSFDLVVGGAILHHLFAPGRAIASAARALKPGGAAIFFEPFEAGNMILRAAYQEILDDKRARKIERGAAGLLARLIADFDVRKGLDKSAPLYQRIDDKWLFTRAWFERLAAEHGFSRCRIDPILSHDGLFARQTETYLRLGIGRPREALPAWAWDRLRAFDGYFSPELKDELIIEGTIILER